MHESLFQDQSALPGVNGDIRIMKDGTEDIRRVNRDDVILTLAGMEPSGEIELSIHTNFPIPRVSE